MKTPDDGALRSLVERYLFWNAAIIDHFFGTAQSGRDVRLTLDDAALETIGGNIGRPAADFVASVRGIVEHRFDVADFRSLSAFDESTISNARPNMFLQNQIPDRSASSSAFSRFSELETATGDPATVALLAAQVLAASRMADAADYGAQAFWPRFNDMFVESGRSQPPPGFDELGVHWRECGRYFNKELGGTRGFLRLPDDPQHSPLIGKRHINYPLSQCLIRETDKRQLFALFAQSRYAWNLDDDELVDFVAGHSDQFGRSFQSLLEQADRLASLAGALRNLLAEIRDDVLRAGDENTRPRGVRLRPRSALRSRVTFRAVGEKYDLVLETRTDDWHEVGRVETAQFLNGFVRSDGTLLRAGAPSTVFLRTEEGFFSDFGEAHDGDVLRIVVQEEFLTSLMAEFDSTTPVTRVPLDRRHLDGLACVSFPFNRELHEVLCAEFGVGAASTTRIELIGGLSVAYRRYILGAPPRIRVSPPVPTAVDGRTIVLDEDGFIPLGALDAGEHEVSSADKHLRFDVVDFAAEVDSAEGDTVGFVLSAAAMETFRLDQVTASALPVDACIVVGADVRRQAT